MPAVAQPIACPKCRAVLGAEFFNQPAWGFCPSCEVELHLDIFPALFREEKIVSGEAIQAPGEASCFYHPEKKAAVVCDSCGRFVCSLCDVDLDGRHLCPTCLEAGRQKGKIAKLEHARTRHDQIALSIAVLPILIFYFTLLTAPTALFYAIWHWKSPGSIVPNHRRLNLVIAIVISSMEIAGWVVFFTWLVIRK
jgi:hypothetical protein